MPDPRKSPTPVHNTGAFSIWVKDAREVADHLAAASADDETCAIVLELRTWALKFEVWATDATKRPPVEERLPLRSQFMGVYRRALARVVELAKARPDGGGWNPRRK
jgi:hypothetical protein